MQLDTRKYFFTVFIKRKDKQTGKLVTNERIHQAEGKTWATAVYNLTSSLDSRGLYNYSIADIGWTEPQHANEFYNLLLKQSAEAEERIALEKANSF